MNTYYTNYVGRKNATPQTVKIPGTKQVQNNAGGFVFEVDAFAQLKRFLILGSDAPTYYVGAEKLTKDNVGALNSALNLDYKRAIDLIVQVSIEGLAPKNDPAVFALAIAASSDSLDVRKYALSKLNDVCRIGTHLFQFVDYVNNLRGWGRGLREAVGRWYTAKDSDKLAHQVLKYQNRNGWSHKDVLRLAHPGGASDAQVKVFQAVTKGVEEDSILDLPKIYADRESSRHYFETGDKKSFYKILANSSLSREMVPTESLTDPMVWETWLHSDRLPMTALIRNLASMTRIGTLSSGLDKNTQKVVELLGNTSYLQAARIHPLNVLIAQRTYASGRSLKGESTWSPVPAVVSALESAFYESFKFVEPTGKAIYLALDVSGSMGSQIAGMPISSCEAGAALGMVWAKTEKRFASFGFASTYKSLGLESAGTLAEATKRAHDSNFGSTDCAQPMIHALSKGLFVDAFIVITDSETYFGKIHPVQALKDYRNKINPAAKLIVMATTPTKFSIADSSAGGMLDVVGFDSSVPQVINNFIKEF